MARLCDFHCRFTMLQSHLWLYKVSKMGEGDLVLMSIDAFEKREQTLQLHANKFYLLPFYCLNNMNHFL